MVSLNWCCKAKDGIKLIEPNENLSNAYIEMAKEALNVMNNEKGKSLRWTLSPCYYSMYYSLYAVMMKLGVKCEIHACTLEFMKLFLLDFYSKDEIKLVSKAFSLRDTIQYYADKFIDMGEANLVISQAPYFVNKSVEILSKLNSGDIEKIRDNLKKIILHK